MFKDTNVARISSRRENLFCDFIQQWTQLFEKCNWYTFTPIFIEFENDTSLGAYEFTFVFMGLGLRIRWNHTRTELLEELEERMAKVCSGDASLKDFFNIADDDSAANDGSSTTSVNDAFTFEVVDNITGGVPDLQKIALEEEWAKGLIYCDMEGFLLSEDGILALADECGSFRYPPDGRFSVKIHQKGIDT